MYLIISVFFLKFYEQLGLDLFQSTLFIAILNFSLAAFPFNSNIYDRIKCYEKSVNTLAFGVQSDGLI